MVKLTELHDYCNDLLAIDRFDDYAPNGLQVEGRTEISRLAAAVTASLETIDAAMAAGADALIVHHGFFWKGEPAPIVGMKRHRIARLLAADMSLLAYHLPLDAHGEYGNNVELGRVLGIEVLGHLPGADLALYGRLRIPMPAGDVADHIGHCLGRAPLHIAGHDRPIRTIGWCTGAAQSYCEQAAMAGLDAYVSGEVSEQTTHVCRELGIDYFAAGHHATERFGVQALARHLARRFELHWKFLDLDNPV